jgi:hypothetical protein
MLWKGLPLPSLAGAGLHGHLDGTEADQDKTITQRTGHAVVEVTNLAYTRWCIAD